MKNFRNILMALTLAVVLLTANSCQQVDGNTTGSEFMPDMAHSAAYEANQYNYYFANTWDATDDPNLSGKTLYELSQPGKPVNGTVPRGYAGVALGSHASDKGGIKVPMNGSAPYYYADTEDERLRATAEIIANPFPITEDGLAKGKELYDIFCATCHGEKGDGAGYLYDTDKNPNAVYPAAPANFLNEEFLAASNGRYYHGIYYGKNVMGSYRDKISYEERWQVIHYIRSLQAKETKTVYDANVNTLNVSFGQPMASVTPVAHADTHAEEAGHDAHNEDGHHDHGHDAGHHEGDGHDHGHEGGDHH